MNLKIFIELIPLALLGLSLLCFTLGIYSEYQKIEAGLRTEKKYYLLGVICMSLSLGVLLFLGNGFSIEIFVFPVCLASMMFILISTSIFIRKKTEEFTGIKDFSSLKSRIQRIINFNNKN